MSNGPCRSPACSRVWLVNADGSQRRPFTPPNLRCEEAAWSPRGDEIAYVQWRRSVGDDNRASIWVRRSDGSQPRRLTFAKGFDSNPVWSPDGSQIAFSRDAKGPAYGNYVMNADGTNLRRLRGNPDNVIESWSSDGSRLASWRTYGRFDNKFLAVIQNADGSGGRELLRQGFGPVWSLDDQYIAFLPEDGDWVSVVGADGTGRRKLVRGRFTQPMNLDWLR